MKSAERAEMKALSAQNKSAEGAEVLRSQRACRISGAPRALRTWRFTGVQRPLRGQAIAEYAILLAVVAAAVATMQAYGRRAIAAGVKVAADQMSPFAADAEGELAQIEGSRQEAGDRRWGAQQRTGKYALEGVALARGGAVRTFAGGADDPDATPGTLTSRAEIGGGVTRTMDSGSASVGVLDEEGAGVSSFSETVVKVK